MRQAIVNAAKSLLGRWESLSVGLNYDPDELIVLCMHSTPANRMDDFARLVDWLTQRFRPVQPSETEAYFNGAPLKGPGILFTFDDGLKNNLHAAQVLEEKGIRAYFFLVPDFIRAGDGRAYYLQNIRPLVQKGIDHVEEDFTPMSPDDIRQLIDRGHAIGSHTMTHLLRAETVDDALTNEIVNSREVLEEMFGVDVRSFCSPISTDISVSAKGKSLIDKNYTLHFTTFPGLNAEERNPRLVLRRNIEVHWPMGKIMFALGKRDLPRWTRKINDWKSL
jgi:peptidoglycan/xylan/chitin deacetylase (PgdA/CDA1 family)